MATDMLTPRQITSKLHVISKIVSQLEASNIAAFFYMQSANGSVFYGDKAIERHIKENLEEIMDQPDFLQIVEPSQIVKDRIINAIELLLPILQNQSVK